MEALIDIFSHFGLPPTKKEKTTRERLLVDHHNVDAWDKLVSEVQ